MSSIASAAAVAEIRQRRAQWAGGLAGPFAWFSQLVGAYVFATWACAGHGRLALHLLSLVCLFVSAAGCRVAWVRWGEIGREWPSSTDEFKVGRARLMGAVGVMASVLFAWIICMHWIAVAVLDPCPP